MATTILAAKQAVRDVVAAALAAAGETDVEVRWGLAGVWDVADIVAVGDVATDRARPRMGTRLGDEEHAVTLVIRSASRDALEQETATARACHLLGVIDEALRSDPSEALTATATAAGITLGQITGQVQLTETPPDEPGQVAKGRNAQLVATVVVRSRRT